MGDSTFTPNGKQETALNQNLQILEKYICKYDPGYQHMLANGVSSTAIVYPSVSNLAEIKCPVHIESDIALVERLDRFSNKVRVNDNPKAFINKGMPTARHVDQFLYNVLVMNALHNSMDMLPLKGVVLDNKRTVIKSLLLATAEGNLRKILQKPQQFITNLAPGAQIPWPQRERWAWQIARGLGELHVHGFIHGDLKLSNILVTGSNNAKISMPDEDEFSVGWEPPEILPLIRAGTETSRLRGTKADIYQLGMILWALATHEPEPEAQERPFPAIPSQIPKYYRSLVENCLFEKPSHRPRIGRVWDAFPQNIR